MTHPRPLAAAFGALLLLVALASPAAQAQTRQVAPVRAYVELGALAHQLGVGPAAAVRVESGPLMVAAYVADYAEDREMEFDEPDVYGREAGILAGLVYAGPRGTLTAATGLTRLTGLRRTEVIQEGFLGDLYAAEELDELAVPVELRATATYVRYFGLGGHLRALFLQDGPPLAGYGLHITLGRVR